MSEKLFMPLASLLHDLVAGMCTGTMSGAYSQGHGDHYWPRRVADQRTLVEEYVRLEIERLTAGRQTSRVAASALRQVSAEGEVPLFTIVVCDASRPKGVVYELCSGDSVYAVTPPDVPIRGLSLRRVKHQA